MKLLVKSIVIVESVITPKAAMLYMNILFYKVVVDLQLPIRHRFCLCTFIFINLSMEL
jgi:hypothetical protein